MPTQTPASLWSRSAGRLVLAGSVAVLVLGYLTLGSFFPRLQVPTGLEKAGSDIGQRPKKPKANTPAPIVNPQDDPVPMP